MVARRQSEELELNDEIAGLASTGDNIMWESVEAVDCLQDVSVCSWKLLLEPPGYCLKQKVRKIYSLSRYESLHNLYLEVSWLPKQCVIEDLSSERLFMNPK